MIRRKRDTLSFPQREHQRLRLFSAPCKVFRIHNRFGALTQCCNVIGDTAKVGITDSIKVAARPRTESDACLIVPIDEVMSCRIAWAREAADFIMRVPVRR